MANYLYNYNTYDDEEILQNYLKNDMVEIYPNKEYFDAKEIFNMIGNKLVILKLTMNFILMIIILKIIELLKLAIIIILKIAMIKNKI